MTNIYLTGDLGEKFGSHWKLEARNIVEAIRGISVQREGFLNYITEQAGKGIHYTIQKGEELINGDTDALLSLGGQDLVISPAVEGSNAKQTIGYILMIASFFIDPTGATATQVAAMQAAVFTVGSMLVMEGTLDKLMKDSPANTNEAYLFNGPENNVKQGIPVPLCYGKLEIGGAPINFGFTNTRVTQSAGFTFKGSTNTNSDEDWIGGEDFWVSGVGGGYSDQGMGSSGAIYTGGTSNIDWNLLADQYNNITEEIIEDLEQIGK